VYPNVHAGPFHKTWISLFGQRQVTLSDSICVHCVSVVGFDAGDISEYPKLVRRCELLHLFTINDQPSTIHDTCIDTDKGVSIFGFYQGQATRRYEIHIKRSASTKLVCVLWKLVWMLEARNWNAAGAEDNALHLASSILPQASEPASTTLTHLPAST